MDSFRNTGRRPLFVLAMGLLVNCVVAEDCASHSSPGQIEDSDGGSLGRDAGAVAPTHESGLEDAGADSQSIARPIDSGIARPLDSGIGGLVDGGARAGDSFTLAISVSGSGSGTTSPAPGTHVFASGTLVHVGATPSSGATFTGWSGASSGMDNPVAVVMNGDRTLTANFDSGGLPPRCPGACDAAALAYPTLSSNGGSGNVAMSSTGASTGGACNYGTTTVLYHASINVNAKPGDGKGQWQDASVCGQCAEVTVLTTQGPKTVLVRIMDKCADEYCGINLGGSAPGAVMLNGLGRYDGTWRFVSCGGHPEVSDGVPSLSVVVGSSKYWARVRVRNPTAAVESIEWQNASGAASGSFPYVTNPENTFEVPVNEVLQSTSTSFLVTVRYTDGSTGAATLSPSQLAAENSAYPLQ